MESLAVSRRGEGVQSLEIKAPDASMSRIQKTRNRVNTYSYKSFKLQILNHHSAKVHLEKFRS